LVNPTHEGYIDREEVIDLRSTGMRRSLKTDKHPMTLQEDKMPTDR
jgi:hypothetical protein